MDDPFAAIRPNILLYFGAEGADWLRRLPETIAWCRDYWQLEILPPFPDLSINYVTLARQSDGSEVVLKLGVPNPELDAEIEALEHYDGRGICALLHSDRERGAMLLE